MGLYLVGAVYLALMVLIFVTPHGRQSAEQVSKSGKESAGGVLTDLDQDLRVDRADEGDHHHLAIEFISGPMVSESIAEPVFFNPDSTSSDDSKAPTGPQSGAQGGQDNR